MVTGEVLSNDGDFPSNQGNNDVWLVKLDLTGNIVWKKNYGGKSNDYAFRMTRSPDGGFVLAGGTESNTGIGLNNHGAYDFLVIKADVNGNMIWSKTYGGTDKDEARYITSTADGNYLVTGYTRSNDGNVSGNHGSDDMWVIKIDQSGNLVWQRTVGGTDDDYGYQVIDKGSGSFLELGITHSKDGDVIGSHGGSEFLIFPFIH